MPQVVEVPGYGDVEFPDDMSDDQIASAIQRNIQPKYQASKPDFGGVNFSSPYEYFSPKVQRGLGNTGAGVQPVTGAGEAAIQVGTGLGASALGGVAGVGQGLWNTLTPRSINGPSAADRVSRVQNALTYQPRTFPGQVASQAVSDAFDHDVSTSKLNPLTYPGRIGVILGDASAEMGGPAALSAGLRTAPEALVPWAVSRGARAIDASRAARPQKKPIPTTEELRKATNEAYKRGEESGVVVPADTYGKAADEIIRDAKAEAIDPKLHPKSYRILEVLEERKGQDLSLQEAENIRRLALEAEGDVNPAGTQSADGFRAGNIVDSLDEKIDALSVNAEARALNRRKANSQLLDIMIERAENKAGANYTQSGMENALRKEFLALANNQRRMKRFTEEQRNAIRKVARGGPMENTLRNIGKFDPTTGGMAAAISTLTSAGLAPITGGASAAIPVLGFGAKRAATALAERNVNAAREALVGRGIPSAPQARAAPTPLSVAPQGPLSSKPPRSAADIQADIQRLIQRAGTRGGPAEAREIWLELSLLQDELERASKPASTSGVLGQ